MTEQKPHKRVKASLRKRIKDKDARFQYFSANCIDSTSVTFKKEMTTTHKHLPLICNLSGHINWRIENLIQPIRAQKLEGEQNLLG